ncbi:MAG: 6-phosphofructokinase [Nitrospirota bacterium]
MKKKLRIGMLTGGGDCPGLNAVIRAVTKTAINDYDMEVYGVEDGYVGLVEKRIRQLSYVAASGILTYGGTILGTSNIANPFKYPIKEGGKVITKDLSDEAIENFRQMGLDVLICIGGDGTLNIGYELLKKGIDVIGIPKTIDNDLAETDITFGFHSALTTATEAIDKIHTTAQSHHRVMVVEVMGRYAGWLALYSGIASGGDIILIPEIPYDINKVNKEVIDRKNSGRHFSIVVVAEGAKPIGGEMVVKKIIDGSPDPVRLGGIGNIIGSQIEENTGVETRVAVLGHLQRGGTPTPFDRILATRFGTSAVRLIHEKRFGCMVALKGDEVVAVPIDKAVESLKTVPVDSPLIKTAKSMGTKFGD